MEKIFITDNGLRANFYKNSVLPSKAVILLGGSGGGMPFSNEDAAVQHFLDIGYSVLCLAYFGYEGLPPTLQRIPLEYFEKAFEWLSNRPDIQRDDYAVMGYSKGAELALLLASRYRQIKAAAAVVPSHVVWQGLHLKPLYDKGKNKLIWQKPSADENPLPLKASSWAYNNTEIKCVPFPPFSIMDIVHKLTFNIRPVYERALKRQKDIETCTIPLENSNADILLLSGEKDRLWPSTPMCESIMERLKKKAYPFSYEHVRFPGGHDVTKEPEYWETIISFFKKHSKKSTK